MEIIKATSSSIASYTYINPFQRWTLFLSALAIFISIAIPVSQFLYRKFKRLKINIIPFEQTALTMFFNESGSYIKLSLCLECKNQDTTIKKIYANIIRNNDNQLYDFEWSTLESIYINWFGTNSSNRINSVSYARPFKINSDTLEPFIIELPGNKSNELKDFCNNRNNQLQRFVQFNDENFKNPNEIYRKFKTTSPEYPKMVSELSTYFFWKAGTYSININVLHDLNKITSAKFTFTISDDESELLRKNIDSIISCRLYENPLGMFNFINKSLS